MPVDALRVSWQPAVTEGLCNVRGCPHLVTKRGKVTGSVLLVDFGNLTVRLCPVHGEALVKLVAPLVGTPR